MQLTKREVLDHILQKHSISISKSMGQNFLVCDEVVEATLACLSETTNNITELGAGLGTLTQALVGSGYAVKAIEKDDEFVQIIPTVIPPKKRNLLTIVHGDLKDTPWTWEDPYALVGNIPYNLSGFILRRITQLEPAPQLALLLMQKEVGQRLMATPPDMNLPALAVQLWGTPTRLLQVPSSCFFPQPNVSSELIAIYPHEHVLPLEEREHIMKTAKIFFQHKRKQMISTLRSAFPAMKDRAKNILSSASIQATQRPQELTMQQWKKLQQALTSPYEGEGVG